MNIFDVLALVGGLCLFLFGMKIMGDGLERRAGNSLKSLLGKLTNSRVKGFLTGLVVTAVIQSSSATTVMVVGFVNSGLMTLRQSIGVIMGANLGTTVTAWILSLGGISSDNVWIQLLKPTSFTPVLALIGTAFMMFSKSDKKKDTGSILLGFATLMFGMDAMSGAVSGLAELPWFSEMFVMFKNPILGVLVGIVLTAMIQSSSASVGVLQALSATGAVSYGAAVPILMGQHIGTCVTALLSSLGTNKNAKRAAVVHLSFNVIGTVVWLTVFTVVTSIVDIAFIDSPANAFGIAVAHSAISVLSTLLLLPMAGLLEKIACKIVPDGKTKEKNSELDDRLLATPTIALEQCSRLASGLCTRVAEGLNASLDVLTVYDKAKAETIRKIESEADHYEDIIGTYLTKLSRHQVTEEDSIKVSKLLKVIGDLERISDHSVNILESAEELRDKQIEITEAAKAELSTICAAVRESLAIASTAYINDNVTLAYEVEPLEEVIDDLKDALRDNHIKRLQQGKCTVEAGFVWSDLLTNLERVSDHCSNIAICVIDAHDHNMDAHSSLIKLKRGNSEYQRRFETYSEKYALQ